MFGPCGKGKLTIEQADGTSYEMNVSNSEFGLMETRVEVVGSGPVTLEHYYGSRSVPDLSPAPNIRDGFFAASEIRQMEDDIIADITSGEPDVLWGDDGPPRPYRPWTWEACMLAWTIPLLVAAWGVWRWHHGW